VELVGCNRSVVSGTTVNAHAAKATRNEITSHVLLCQGEGADSEWKDRILHLGLWLSEVDTHPLIHQCLINSLSQ
jgi:hypothetical protein